MGIELLVVNYHYLREKIPERGIYNITPKGLVGQLCEIGKSGFRFIAGSDIHKAVSEADVTRISGKCCLVTFDDGLRESYEMGIPILDKLGVPAIFYTPTMILNKYQVLDVHKLHYIQSILKPEEIIDLIPVVFKDILKTVPLGIIQSQYKWDNDDVAKMKYLINFLLQDFERKKLLQDLFQVAGASESEYANKIYMSTQQIQKLSSRDYLGSHGVSHIPLAKIAKDEELFDELELSKKTLENICGNQISSVSYPYGGSDAVNLRVFQAAKKAGYTFGFTMTPGINRKMDLLSTPLELKRFDTNDVMIGVKQFLE